MKTLTRLNAQPILDTLEGIGYNPKLVGSIATRGKSDNDIDITMPVKLERDVSPGITHRLINRESQSLKAYYQAMKGLGFECIIAPPFSENDTWRRDDTLVDIWLYTELKEE